MKQSFPSYVSPPDPPKLPAAFNPPVFVVGSARSGTTLLYHSLLSSGDFAVYRTEPAVFDLLAPKFGNLAIQENLVRLLPVWFRSYQYRLSGLDRSSLERTILAECHSNGDFLRIVMEHVTLQQGAKRWAVWGPDNLLHIPSIAHTIPNALFIHVIRDGRDVALSLSKEGWIRPFPWDRGRRLLVAALHWKWKVERGRQFGRHIPSRYLEIRFEDLVTRAPETLANIGRFIGHQFDYGQIQKRSIGTLSKPNSTFVGTEDKLTFNPVGRWKNHLTMLQIANLESIIGSLLDELGYPLEFARTQPGELHLMLMSGLYPAFFGLKEWLKSRTILGRLISTNRLRFSDAIAQ
jgi:Sulfotransferase family